MSSTVNGRWVIIGAAADQYGADAMLRYIARHFHHRGDDTTIILPEEGPLSDLLRASNLQVPMLADTLVVRKSLRTPRRMLRELIKAPARILKHARIIVSLPGAGVYINTVTVPLWAIVSRLLKRHTVIHVHEIIGGQTLGQQVARKVLYSQLLLAHSVICVSDAVRRDILGAYPRLHRSTHTILNCDFESGSEHPAPSTQARADCSDFVVVGRLSPRKGQHLVLDALSKFPRDDQPTVTFVGTVFPGYEWYENELRAEAAKLDLKVAFGGFLPTEQAFAQGRTVIIPSTVPDPAPLVTLEALRRGRLVIGAAIGGIPELLGEAGIQFPPNDQNELFNCMRSSLELGTQERARLENLARKRSTQLTPEAYWRQFDSVVRRESVK